MCRRTSARVARVAGEAGAGAQGLLRTILEGF